MEITEKVKLARELEGQISEVKSFIETIENGQKYDTKYKTQNYFTLLELNAKVCTGSDFSRRERTIINQEIIKACVNSMKPVLEEIVKTKEIELKSLFKE